MKEFENRLRSDRNITMSMVSPSFMEHCIAACSQRIDRNETPLIPSRSKGRSQNTDVAVRSLTCITATGTHMPYRITQCYLPPDIPAFTPAEVGTRLSDPKGTQLG